MTKIKQARLALGYSQVDTAVKIGVSLMTYQLWEKGAMKPNPENLPKLLEVLEIDTIQD